MLKNRFVNILFAGLFVSMNSFAGLGTLGTSFEKITELFKTIIPTQKFERFALEGIPEGSFWRNFPNLENKIDTVEVKLVGNLTRGSGTSANNASIFFHFLKEGERFDYLRFLTPTETNQAAIKALDSLLTQKGIKLQDVNKIKESSTRSIALGYDEAKTLLQVRSNEINLAGLNETQIREVLAAIVQISDKYAVSGIKGLKELAPEVKATKNNQIW